MKMEKIWIAIVISLILVLNVVGCGNNANTSEKDAKSEQEAITETKGGLINEDSSNIDGYSVADTDDKTEQVTNEAADVFIDGYDNEEVTADKETTADKDTTSSEKDSSNSTDKTTTNKNTSTTSSNKGNTSSNKNNSSSSTTNNDSSSSSTSGSNSGTSGSNSGNSNNSGTTSSENAPSTSTHTHTWEEVREEVVVEEAWVEEVYGYRTLCGKCKEDLTDVTSDERLWHSSMICGSRYSTEYVKINEIPHEAVTEEQVVGYKCNCGATKSK